MSILSLDCIYTKDPVPSGSYPDAGDIELTDGLVDQHSCGGIGCCDVGWNTGRPVIRLDLGCAYSISSVRVRYGEDHSIGVYEPASVEIKGSMDDITYITITTFSEFTSQGDGCYWADISSLSGGYQYIKFIFVRGGTWLMLSELEVYGGPAANISGSIKELGAGVARTVRAYIRSTGALYSEGVSEGDGSFSISAPDTETVLYVVALPDVAGGDYNALVMDGVKGIAL